MLFDYYSCSVAPKVNNHPQRGWLDSSPVSGADQGHVSAMGALFREPSPKAIVFQKTINYRKLEFVVCEQIFITKMRKKFLIK